MYLFIKTIKNIVCNYIPHETIICNDIDPPWINNNIKKMFNDKNCANKSYHQNVNDSSTFQNFQFLQSRLNLLIEKSNLKYYARLSKKLLDPMTSLKTYWSRLKIFLNNKKIPCIPPSQYENKFIIDFRRKPEIFNTFFAKQCSLIYTCSNLPTTLTKETSESLSMICFASDDILKIIKNLDPNKAHSHDIISTRKVKLCDASLCKLLELIFKSCLESGNFPLEWKKQMSLLHTKKEISKYWKITVPYLCFPLPEKYLKEYCIIICLNFLQKII